MNGGGGSFGGAETERIVRDELARHDLDANIHIAGDGGEIASIADAAASSDAAILIAGGGDGTINTVAARAVENGKTLGIIPLGTRNHFARDLGIPLDIAGAIEVIAQNHTRKVDVGEVNGRIFINNSSIGLYPRIVRRRKVEQERLGRGKWSAALSAAWRVFLRDPFVKVRIRLQQRQFVRKTPFVFIGNNEYHMDLYNIGGRPTLDDGHLSLYFLHRGGRWGVIMLLIKTVFGALRQAREFETLSIEKVTLTTHRKRVVTAIDGETVLMESPLEYRIRPGELRVIAPPADAIGNNA